MGPRFLFLVAGTKVCHSTAVSTQHLRIRFCQQPSHMNHHFFFFIIVHAVRLRQTWTFMFNKNNGQNFVHTNRKGGVRFGQPPYNKLEKRLVAGSSSWSVSLHSSVLLATW